MILELHDGGGNVLATIDLGKPTDIPTHAGSEANYLDDGDLDAGSGNIWLIIDGVDYGSLWFTAVGGKPRIELGQYDATFDQWETRNPITQAAVYE